MCGMVDDETTNGRLLLVLAHPALERRGAHELLRAGARHIERESFESAVSMRVEPLKALRAAQLFRQLDLTTFHSLAPLRGEKERDILADGTAT
jgi:hypothetical protein